MEPNRIESILKNLFRNHFDAAPLLAELLPKSGSERVYYRLKNEFHSVIGAFNPDKKENDAFIGFTKSFRHAGINVPEVLEVSDDGLYYLVTDLGTETLYDRIKLVSSEPDGASKIICLVKKSLIELIRLQSIDFEQIDFSLCYPRAEFDRQSVQWDLNYFKYNFLKLAEVPFDEQLLENDFQQLSDNLMSAPMDSFMLRDFQSRNIMLVDEVPWFIDYQGGRKGPFQYDVASLLYSPGTGLNDVQKEMLFQFYLDRLATERQIDRIQFERDYYNFVLVRILQAFGAYGFRGLFQKKANFRNSIPVAVSNLLSLMHKDFIREQYPELFSVAQQLSVSKLATPFCLEQGRLTITVRSFSYRKGIPDDPSDNGGGFVFDCRGLPNPGRFSEYRSFSGLDQSVIDYLEKFDEVKQFQESARKMTGLTVNEYLNRKFNHLCVSFGCTGGQHRSVYMAEKMAKWLENNFQVKVVLYHTEECNWRTNG